MERNVQKSRSYQDLEVWKLSINFVKEIFGLTEKFPPIEIYGLTNQIRRAAVSIPSNIAEGQGRSSAKEFRQFLAIALGSLAEIETQLIITREALAKLPIDNNCHSERSEESCIFKRLRSFTSFRMTEKLVLQEAREKSICWGVKKRSHY